jgi:hypothetical protein
VLASGDLLVFLLFPLLGSASHEHGLTIGTFLRTTIPFAIAWSAVAPWLGAYDPRAGLSVRGAVLRSLRAWAIAGPVALAVRIVLLDRPFDLAFVLVALGVTAALLATWRTLYALAIGIVNHRTQR